ncbi:DNA methylase family protein [Asticcacaulis biprosthecium C19]|uniref:site-specific DNA-methyltransferase (adenine-specific) n=1 Tax=Asticcacaulis biprosthecium C19 TaxID=715226 RepID=F4QP29_9CAUL|nr:site-specific DNA-methyltransferase [Asticcacaulis biprosthecium]EGF91087.1 DNA methylase family protein [Asticcacaulis biprosthecium C19]
MAKKPLEVDSLKHTDATRRNIPTAEFESLMRDEDKTPVQVAYERRNRDLDPQLVWRGKDVQDHSDLVVQAPPLYIQEKVHPKVLIDDLKRETEARRARAAPPSGTIDMFGDFNGLPDMEAKTEFYRHDQHWANRMISGDSLSVMASLAEREGLRGKVQCIYFDPPYGIKFNSNFQWSTTSRDVKDGAKDHITREPEQVRAFRDTWKDGIHSYLTYLRDRLVVARDLLHESGSIFVQIGDENVHRVRSLMDEVFGDENFASLIAFKKTTALTSEFLSNNFDYIVWYARSRPSLKYRSVMVEKGYESDLSFYGYTEDPSGSRRRLESNETADPLNVYSVGDLTSSHDYSLGKVDFNFLGRKFHPGRRYWTSSPDGMRRMAQADRIHESSNSVRFVRFLRDYPVQPLASTWVDTVTGQYTDPRLYVVQTATKVVQRCILMTTDPGDLVLDPTCGSGTTAYAAEQWGRRWITIDTSRVAIALARSRLMGARYPYYLLADSPEGQQKEAEVTRSVPKSAATNRNIRQGFVYDRVPHITLKSIANNAEIDVIWEGLQPAVEAAIAELNAALTRHGTPFLIESGGRAGSKIDFTAGGENKLPSGEMAPANGFMEWEIPREAPSGWPDDAQKALTRFWEARIARQRDINASINAKAEFEYLFDKPYSDNSKVRVAGPFTVESLSPHRTLVVDWNDELIDPMGFQETGDDFDHVQDFAGMILENLKAAGVQQAHKEDKINFTALTGWPGTYICAEGRYEEGETQRKAAIFIGPEFGTVSRPDLVAAAREAGDAGFDVLIACAFNYDAHSSEFERLGRIPVLKARMNPDLHMAKDLKSTGAGNLFVIFGEPDIQVIDAGNGQIQVKVAGVDVFKPQSGEVLSEGTDGIALWMLDTDYNEESFFVRHAYFLGANDPYKALKTSLKAEIDPEAWETLYSDTSRPFARPASRRIAVKVINHLGDEVMKVFAV